MVTQQIRSWDVTNKKILESMLSIHREEFVPTQQRKLAFADIALPLGHQVYMMKPVVEGRMLQAIDLQANETVLEIGTGSGYVTGLMAKLCQHVTSIDLHEDLIQSAQNKLQEAHIDNTALEVADFFDYEPGKQFDAIVITGSLKALPKHVFSWLKPDGRVFAIVGQDPIMEARVYTAADEYSSHFDTLVTPLQQAKQHQPFLL
ncbi:protein-L-isoaspartate O-methyltransferase [Marinicella sp. W31]|uniref:protein-L-isoaspartate O-methyltransferase family protein n=1 Tax=Marinicella sp. W31 TaxID=3023713 RepID=UPI0037569FCA